MELLASLGVNETVGLQFIIFICVYFVLSRMVFTPYYNAFVERTRRTVGNTDVAEKLLSDAKNLEQRYQEKARAQNLISKEFFETARKSAQVEYQTIVDDARSKAKIQNDNTLEKIKVEMARVQPQIKNEVQVISQSIVAKLLGKDLAV